MTGYLSVRTLTTATGASTHEDAATAVREAWSAVVEAIGTPDVVIALSTVGYPLQTVFDTLRELAPNVPIQGGSSSGGVMTDQGFFGVDGRGLGLLGMCEENGDFGVGAAPLAEGARDAGATAMCSAMHNAKCPGEMPSAVWIITTPGGEEEVVRGIEDVIGTEVPLIGGSAADNSLSGEWRQFSSDGVVENHVSILAIYTGARVSTALLSGYDPTRCEGTVTKAEGRIVQEIDNQPASAIYNDWLGGSLSDVIGEGGEILARTNLSPLGRKVGEVKGVPHYLLSHPERAFPNGGMQLFTDVSVGETLMCMTGSVDNLVERASNAVLAAMHLGGLEKAEVCGGLVVFCGGCLMSVGDRIDEVYEKISTAMGGQPFITAFTFGEQGRVLGAGNRHGNLMISALLLGDEA